MLFKANLLPSLTAAHKIVDNLSSDYKNVGEAFEWHQEYEKVWQSAGDNTQNSKKV